MQFSYIYLEFWKPGYLQISIDLHHNGKTRFYSNLMKMVDYFVLNYDFSCNSLIDSIVNRYIGIMKNKYVSYWNQTLQQSQKLSFYCTIKDDYSPSPYLVLTRKNPSRKALVKIRISSHQLRIETGRYEKSLVMKGYVPFVQVTKLKMKIISY